MQHHPRATQRKISDMTGGNLMRSSDLVQGLVGGGPGAASSPMHETQHRFQMNQQVGAGQQPHPTLKVQDLLRNVNNKSNTSHH